MKKLPIESALRWAESYATGYYASARNTAERNSSLGVTAHVCLTLAREVRLLRKAIAANKRPAFAKTELRECSVTHFNSGGIFVAIKPSKPVLKPRK